MLQSVTKATGSGLTEQLKEEEWAAKEIHLTDDKHRVSELPKSPNYSSLIALYLQRNYELTAIPPHFFQRMLLLQVLDLSHTSIKSLPKSLPKLVALKKLLLRGCDLFMELSPQVGKLKNLEEIDLDETQIMDLPREIGKLVKLRHLRLSFYHICGKKKSKSNFVIHPKTISNLLQLVELSIDVNPADKRWDDSVEAVVKEVCNSKTLRTLSLYLPKVELLDNTSLIYPSLSHFRFTVGHHKRRIISRVPHEVEAEFRNWDKCLKFVNGENIPIEIKKVLKYSSSFFLDHHATAMNLSEFGIQNMKRLKFCLLAECNKMETLIDRDMHDERNEDDQSESDSGSVVNVLESLEYLSIYYMENLWSIWRGPNRYGCMSNLKFLALHACPQLRNIFSHTLLENFVNLEEIILEDCPQVTSLVTHASVKPMTSDKFLPSLKRLLLLYLPELVSISNGLLIAPKLESIGFYNCPKLKCILKLELSSKSLKMIKGESQWWEDMNWIETEWGNRPDYLMRIFSPINNEKDVMTQLVEGRDLVEATIQNEGQQLDDKKLLEVSTQDHQGEIGQGQGLDYTEETKSATNMTESTPSDSSKAPAQAWSFFPSKENKRLEDDCFDRDSEICEFNVDEDEPKAKRCNSAENEKKSVVGAVNKTSREHIIIFRTRTDTEVVDDGYSWRKYGTKVAKGIRHASFYYRCTTRGCPVKKKVERDTQDASILITAYKGVHNHGRPYALELYNLHTGLCNDRRANNQEDGAEAAKTISPRKGYGDVFEASVQDKGAHTGIPEASVRDELQQSVKSKRSAEAYTWWCYGTKGLIENRREGLYKCSYPSCTAMMSVERSLDGQITEVIHNAWHNHPESQPTTTSSLSVFSRIIRASNHLTIKIPDQSFVTYEGGCMDAKSGSVVYMREPMVEVVPRAKKRLVKTNPDNFIKLYLRFTKNGLKLGCSLLLHDLTILQWFQGQQTCQHENHRFHMHEHQRFQGDGSKNDGNTFEGSRGRKKNEWNCLEGFTGRKKNEWNTDEETEEVIDVIVEDSMAMESNGYSFPSLISLVGASPTADALGTWD